MVEVEGWVKVQRDRGWLREMREDG